LQKFPLKPSGTERNRAIFSEKNLVPFPLFPGKRIEIFPLRDSSVPLGLTRFSEVNIFQNSRPATTDTSIMQHPIQPIDFDTGTPLDVQRLDKGVRAAVEELMRLGATPLASCDGHCKARGWYVLFTAPHPVAQSVADRGYLTVALVPNKPNTYLLTTPALRGVADWLNNKAPNP
jgi:hypothetical protein